MQVGRLPGLYDVDGETGQGAAQGRLCVVHEEPPPGLAHAFAQLEGHVPGAARPEHAHEPRCDIEERPDGTCSSDAQAQILSNSPRHATSPKRMWWTAARSPMLVRASRTISPEASKATTSWLRSAKAR